MENNILTILKEAKQGNNELKLEILSIFKPLIKKYSRKLYFEDSEMDLIIFLLELINEIDIDKFNGRTEKEIYGYICISIKRKYINMLSCKINSCEDLGYESDIIIPYDDTYYGLDNRDLISLMCNLTDKQKKVIIGKYIYGYSDVELAKTLETTKQYIYKIKKLALKKILENIKSEG